MPDNFEDWVHLKITDEALSKQLDEMVAEDDSDRSKFIRKLIKDEAARRARRTKRAFATESTTGSPRPSRMGDR